MARSLAPSRGHLLSSPYAVTDMRPRLFGTAGIRGVTNLGITPELALRLARVYGDFIARRARPHGSVAVGHDTRWGAEMLARAAQAGFASAGLNVQFYGCVPSGVFALNVARTGQDGGLLVTGSHLPPDRIGLILEGEILADHRLLLPFQRSQFRAGVFHRYPNRSTPAENGQIETLLCRDVRSGPGRPRPRAKRACPQAPEAGRSSSRCFSPS
ncbi:MAG: hypothetical protein ACK44W_01840 [Planctomycetota bacterium]